MYSGQDEAQEDQLNGKSIYMKKTTFPLFVLQKEKIINVKQSYTYYKGQITCGGGRGSSRYGSTKSR
jgi:hypothetical protein